MSELCPKHHADCLPSLARECPLPEWLLLELPTSGAGNEVLVKTSKGRAMIKTFICCRDGQYRFDSVNANSDPIYIPENEEVDVHFVGANVNSPAS